MWSALLALGSFGLYLSTLCPTVWVEDSGELTSASVLLGVAHPPGYPLYCLISKLISVILPLGSLAFRINLASAVMASASVVLVYHVCRRWPTEKSEVRSQKSEIFAVATAGCWAVSHTLWSQSRDAEVYTLTALMVVAVWRLIQDMIQGRASPRLWELALIFGLGVVTHHTLLLMAPLLMLMAWRVHSVWRISWMGWVGALAVFQLGLILVVYMPLRSLVNTGVDWGDPETFSRLAGHLLRKQYGQLSAGGRFVNLDTQLAVYGRYWMAQLTPWLAWLPLAGVISALWTWKKSEGSRRWVMAAALVGWGCVGLGLIVMINYPDNPYDMNLVHVFFIPSYFFLLLWAYEALSRWWPRVVPSGLALALVVVPVWHHWDTISLSRTYAGYDYGFNTLITPPSSAILFAASDNQKFTSAYLKLVEGFREDLTVYDETGCVFDHILGSETQVLESGEVTRLQRQVGRASLETGRPVFHAVGSNMAILLNQSSLPEGVVSTFGVPSGLPHWRRYNLRSLQHARLSNEYMLREALGQYELSWAESWFAKGREDEAVKHLARGSRIVYDIAPAHNNLAITYAHHQYLNEAEGELLMAMALNPQYAIAQQNLEIVRRMQREKQLKVKSEK